MASNGGMPEPGPQAAAPADIVGVRPPGEPRHGAVELVWHSLVAVRFHLWRLVKITCYAGAICVPAGAMLCCPYNYFRPGLPWWFGHLPYPLLLPLAVPVFAGYDYAFLLEFVGLRPKPKVVFQAFTDRRLYVNVLVAAGVPYAVSAVIMYLTAVVFPYFREPMPDGTALGTRLVFLIPDTLARLAMLPFAFAGLDALAAGHAFHEALKRSIGFLVGQRRLFTGFVLVSLAYRIIFNVFQYYAGMPKAALLGWGAAAGALVAVVLIGFGFLLSMLPAAMEVFFYREFVWREREAAATPPQATPPQA
jgi:hypothetical protein